MRSEVNALGRLVMRAAPVFNAPVAALVRSGRFGRLLQPSVALLSYTGRRSGRRFSIPVMYCRRGDTVTIDANMPDAKTWWRNFLGGGGPLTLRIGGTEHPGHAIATREGNGRVTVTVQLRPAAEA